MMILIGHLYDTIYSNTSYDNKTYSSSCPFINCLSCDAVVMDGHVNMTINGIRNHFPLLAEAHVIQAINSSHDGLVYYIKLSNEEQGGVNIDMGSILHMLHIITVDKLLHFNSSLFRRAFLVCLLTYCLLSC